MSKKTRLTPEEEREIIARKKATHWMFPYANKTACGRRTFLSKTLTTGWFKIYKSENRCKICTKAYRRYVQKIKDPKKRIIKPTCAYCGKRCEPRETQIEHIIPKSKGGAKRKKANLAISCIRCNIRKSSLSIEDFIAKEKQKRKEIMEEIAYIDAILLHTPKMIDKGILEPPKETRSCEYCAKPAKIYLGDSKGKHWLCDDHIKKWKKYYHSVWEQWQKGIWVPVEIDSDWHK